MIPLFEDETVEDLQRNGLRMIQGKNLFRFGEDSVLLAHFAAQSLRLSGRSERSLVDLGCNCGFISLLLSQKLPGSRIAGVEITRRAAEIFERNIRLNRLEDRVFCLHADWNRLDGLLPPGKADAVISNPPYRVSGQNSPSKNAARLFAEPGDGAANAPDITDMQIAREEICSSLDQLMDATYRLLKNGGKAFFIYRANRLADVLSQMRAHRIEPRRLRMVAPFCDKAPTAFLVMGQKNGRPGGFAVEKPLILYDKPSCYTREVTEMYGNYPPLSDDALYKDIERCGTDSGNERSFS